MNMILVIGGTGNVGRQVRDQLWATGATVRVFARTASPAGLPAGVEVASGDLSAPETLAAALAGIDTVFLIWPFLTPDGAPAVLETIAKDARRVVYLSSSGVNEAAERQTDLINQLHADLERLVAGSGLEWTVLRSNTIASNARGWAEQVRAGDVVRGPGFAPTAVIDERDVAAVAALVLTGAGHEGATHVLTGPEVLSRADQVAAIGAAVGRPLRYETVPTDVARQRMLADGRPPALVEALLASAETRPHSDLITPTVEKLTGAPARTFPQWAADHADDFR